MVKHYLQIFPALLKIFFHHPNPSISFLYLFISVSPPPYLSVSFVSLSPHLRDCLYCVFYSALRIPQSALGTLYLSISLFAPFTIFFLDAPICPGSLSKRTEGSAASPARRIVSGYKGGRSETSSLEKCLWVCKSSSPR